MPSQSGSRRYRKQARAENEQDTHRRITEAAVELHRSKGPANTTVSDVAKLARVSRMTVYNHFANETELFTACSTHWASNNPFPDPMRWASIEDPARRLAAALAELYQWYDEKQDMLGKVFRDMPIVPALQTVMAGLWTDYVSAMIDVLSKDWPVADERRADLRSALALAVDFHSWQVLTQSVPPQRAATLAAHLIASGFPSSRAS